MALDAVLESHLSGAASVMVAVGVVNCDQVRREGRAGGRIVMLLHFMCKFG